MTTNPNDILRSGVPLQCSRGLFVVAMCVVVGCNGYPYQGASPYPPPTVTSMPGAVSTGAAPVAVPAVAGPPLVAVPGSPGTVYAPPQTSPQMVQMQQRIQQLDESNRQLTTQIAQLQQQSQAYQQRSELLARQLDDSVQQNKQLLASTQQYATQARGLQASMTARGGARITANNSLTNTTNVLRIDGASVVPEGDTIRVRISADQLFSPGGAQITPSGTSILDQVANALTSQYARRRTGVEGHTDSSQLYGGFSTPYQLSGAQAQVVMDQLVGRNRVPTQQLFVAAHGPNRPIANNNTPAGRAENRRIEIVIYPETF